MPIVACSVDGCTTKARSLGLCRSHYEKQRRHGDPTWTRTKKSPEACTAPDCDRPRVARGLCQLHRDRMRRNGTLETVRFTKRLCSIEGCAKTAKSRGWCPMHYARWLRHGEAGAVAPMLGPRPVIDGRRECKGCEEWLPVADFNAGSWPGSFHHKCRECQRADNIAWREANPDYWTNWQKANPDKVLAIAHKRRAQKLSREHEDIDRDRVFAASDYTCKLCGEPLDMSAKFPAPLSPSIDHIIPLNKGGAHLYANVQAAHFVCNSAKGDRILT